MEGCQVGEGFLIAGLTHMPDRSQPTDCSALVNMGDVDLMSEGLMQRPFLKK